MLKVITMRLSQYFKLKVIAEKGVTFVSSIHELKIMALIAKAGVTIVVSFPRALKSELTTSVYFRRPLAQKCDD